MILNLIFLVLNISNLIFAQTSIKTISPCIGELNDGKRVDLTTLASQTSYK